MFPSSSQTGHTAPGKRVRDTESSCVFIPDTWQQNWSPLPDHMLIQIQFKYILSPHCMLSTNIEFKALAYN